jgi:hypothetical protein
MSNDGGSTHAVGLTFAAIPKEVLQGCRLHVPEDSSADCHLWGIHKMTSEYGNQPPVCAILRLVMCPSVTLMSLDMAGEVEDFDVTFPNGSTVKHFMQMNGFAVICSAFVLLLNLSLQQS